jgi:hypothetical protein
LKQKYHYVVNTQQKCIKLSDFQTLELSEAFSSYCCDTFCNVITFMAKCDSLKINDTIIRKIMHY